MSLLKRATASGHLIDSLFHAASAMGVDAAKLERSIGFRRHGYASDGSRIPLAALAGFWAALRDMSGEGSVGLRMAASIEPDRWGVFARSIGASATLGDALVRAGRFMPLLVEGVDLGFHVSGTRGAVTYRSWGPGTNHPDSVEFALALIARYAFLLSDGRARFESVSFSHGRPVDIAAHEQFFGVTPDFGRPVSSISVDCALLHMPVPAYDATRCEEAERMAQEALERMVRVQSVVRRTEAALRHELEECLRAPTVDRVAEKLGIPSRTLSRRLKAEGMTFQEILDTLRHHLADRYLSESDMSIGQVAYALGYSDPSAFNKAFRRWTGRAPHEYRRRSSAPPPPMPAPVAPHAMAQHAP